MDTLKRWPTNNSAILPFAAQEYNLPEVKDRQFLIAMHKKAMKAGFKIQEYNRLKAEAAQIESDLRRLRDPLFLRSAPPASTGMQLFKAGQTETDRLFQTALTSPTVAALDTSSRPSLRQRLSSIFQSATQKLKKKWRYHLRSLYSNSISRILFTFLIEFHIKRISPFLQC